AVAFLSAALRHLRDAEHLATFGPFASYDQAYHLAGFAPECARKATLASSTFDKAIGHGVASTSEMALALVLSIDLRGHRYDLTHWGARYPALAAWTEQVRYDPTGTHKQTKVLAVLSEARQIVDRIVFALWADGLVPETFPW